MRIFVKSLLSETQEIYANSVLELQEKIDTPSDHYSLWYNGKVLSTSYSLDEYSITEDSVLFQKMRLTGGGNIFGRSTNTATVQQTANAEITQRYTGVCNIQCIASTSNVSVIIIDSNIEGGITVTNECSLDATCNMNATQQASNQASLQYFGVQEASTAPGLSAQFGSTAKNTIYASQTFNLETNQILTQECNLVSSADLTNVTIYAQSSNLTGGITVANSASNGGACVLEASMVATSEATGLVENNQTAKGTKVAKKGNNKSAIWIWIGAIIIAIIIIFIIIAIAKKGKAKSPEEKALEDAKTDEFVNGTEPVSGKEDVTKPASPEAEAK